jgi:hypothetical protein
MEFLNKIFSYSHFQYTTGDTSSNSVEYILSFTGYTGYDESTMNFTQITNALYSKFPPNQFTTSPDATSGFTIITTVESHNVNIGDNILLKPFYGDVFLYGLNKVIDVGNEYGGNPSKTIWLNTPYTAYTAGLAINKISEVLSFFKGFDIQPTYDSINQFFYPFIENYLDSPDVDVYKNIDIGQYIDVTPRRVFNDLGYTLITSGGTTGSTINVPIYLTQTLDNIGLYSFPFSSSTDTTIPNVLPIPDIYYIKYGINYPGNPVMETPNTFPWILIDGITANTYSDFYETSPDQITGYTSEKSSKVRKYIGDGIRSGYYLGVTPTTYRYTLERNVVNGINDGYIEYTSLRPLSASTRSYFNYSSWGRSPDNGIIPNTGQIFCALVHDSFNLGQILETKIKNDVFIDRGVFSPFERVYKLGFLRTIDDIESFEKGDFNVIKDIPLSSMYLANG